MVSQQLFISAFIGLSLMSLVITEYNSQTPKPCCTAKLYSVGVAILSTQPAQQGIPEQLVSQEGMYYFDSKNKRIALNTTVQYLNSQQPVQQVYQIQDFGKKWMYVILNNKTCQRTPLSGDFPSNDCIPADAKFRGTVKLGESYTVNRWFIDANPVRQEISMTNKCVPVTSVVTQQGGEGISMFSQEYFNFKASIDHPDQKFTPPSFCNHAPLSDTENDIISGAVGFRNQIFYSK